MNVRGAGGLACVRDVRLLVAFVQSDLRSRERLPSGGGNRGKSQDRQSNSAIPTAALRRMSHAPQHNSSRAITVSARQTPPAAERTLTTIVTRRSTKAAQGRRKTAALRQKSKSTYQSFLIYHISES